MLTFPGTVRVYAAAEPVDLRKGFDGLSLAVRTILGDDPLSGSLFVFFNRGFELHLSVTLRASSELGRRQDRLSARAGRTGRHRIDR